MKIRSEKNKKMFLTIITFLGALLLISLVASMFSTKTPSKPIPKICEHVYGEWETIVEPSCSAEGEAVKTCTLCDDKETIFIAKTEHWGEEQSRVESTCMDYGEIQYICTRCGEHYTETISTLADHTISAWTLSEDSSIWSKSCTVCGTQIETSENPEITLYVAIGINYYDLESGSSAQGYVADIVGDNRHNYSVGVLANDTYTIELQAVKTATGYMELVVLTPKNCDCTLTDNGEGLYTLTVNNFTTNASFTISGNQP